MIVCIDIGGGTTRIGFSTDGKTFEEIIKFPTFDDFDEVVNKIIEEIKIKTDTPEKISIAAPGTLDRKKGKLISWGQKHSWWGKSFFEPLNSNFPNANLKLEHDADVAALGEACFGAGVNYSSFGFITFSSGIGGALIENKRPARVSVDNEVGHQIVNFSETNEWSCGQKGCWESYASGTAFKKIFGIPPEECNDPEIWAKYGKFVAPGLANMMLLWRPEAILIGGGVSNKFESFISPLKDEVGKSLGTYKNLVCDIVKAELDEPGLYGGLVL
jgi:glucokinase